MCRGQHGRRVFALRANTRRPAAARNASTVPRPLSRVWKANPGAVRAREATSALWARSIQPRVRRARGAVSYHYAAASNAKCARWRITALLRRRPLCPVRRGTTGTRLRLGDAAFCSPCVPPTSSSEGSQACSWCERGFFSTRTANDSAISCVPCPENGKCAPNTTLPTLRVLHGFWRLSEESQEVYKCAQAGPNKSTPCRGGRVAGFDGEGYCTEGHRGPRCEALEPVSLHIATVML